MFPASEALAVSARRAQSRLHEAGHAIVADRVGLAVHDVVVVDGGGHTVYRVPTDASIGLLEADLVATLAGIEAEEVAAGPGRYGQARARAGTDQDHARAAAARLSRLRATSISSELDGARRRAAHLVSEQWSSIDRLARSLELNDDELRGPECVAAIAAARRGTTWRRPARANADPTTSTSAWGWRGSGAVAARRGGGWIVRRDGTIGPPWEGA